MEGINWIYPRCSIITPPISPAHIKNLSDLFALKRIREPVNRSSAGVRGKVFDFRFGIYRHAESLNEFNGFKILITTARPDFWLEQPFSLDYHHAGKKHRYIPDILIVSGTHWEVVEIKEDSQAALPENQERFQLIEQHLSDHRFSFRIWKKSEIFAEPRLSNVLNILSHRHETVTRNERESIRKHFSSSEITLGDLCKDRKVPIQKVFSVVLEGDLHINWWESITLNSMIGRKPLGPQIWPSPLSNTKIQ